MRRLLGAFLVLLFWLGPLVALLPADDESRLPPCCRRHGAHHCAMAAAMASRFIQPGSAPILAAPSHCPSYPGSAAASTVTIHALPALAAALPVLLTPPHAPAVRRASACLSRFGARASRAPPASDFA